MRKHTINYYMSQNGTLTPPDSMLKEIAESDWWICLKPFFDDLLWQYFADREIFYNDKYDPSDEAATINNILRTFTINLRTKEYKYRGLYETTILDYDPLYNVDATEHTERTLDQTGTDENKLSGTDTTTRSGSETDEKEGTEAITKSGNETDAKEGTEAVTKSGNETDEKEGTEAITKSGNETDAKEGTEAVTKTGSESKSFLGDNVETTEKTTYDDDDFYGTEKKTTTPGATETDAFTDRADTTSFTDRVDTHTYNDVKDETSFDDRIDTHTYNDVKEETSFDDRKDTHTYNDVKEETSFDDRIDTHTYNDVEDSTEYGRTDTETRDLHDREIIDHRRFGNIGVTSSQSLVMSQRSVVDFDWMKRVIHDCVNCVSYSIY